MHRLIESIPSNNFWFWFSAVAISLLLGLTITWSLSAALFILVLLIVVVPLAIPYLKNNHIGLALIILSIVPGQLVRLSLGTDVRGGSAIILTDIFILLLIIVWGVKKLVYDKKFNKNEINAPLILFTVIALISLIQGYFILGQLGTIELKEIVVSFLYWVRWVMYAFVFFITTDLIKKESHLNMYLKVLFWVGVLVSIAGFIQLALVPDFTKYAIKYGWDPHQDRLLSTFFDPNFVGGFLAMVMAVATGIWFYTPSKKEKTWLSVLLVITGVALMLTVSRSGLLALVTAMGIIGLLRSKLFLFLGIAAILLVVLTQPRLVTRITEGLSVDETGALRIQSWYNAASVTASYPVLGVGYNTLASVNDDLGLVDEFDVNNRGGVENSILSIFVTTGVVGLTAFLWLYLIMLKKAYDIWKDKEVPPRWRGFSLGLLAAMLGIIMHSIFINSLLYPFILIYIWIWMGMLVRIKPITAPSEDSLLPLNTTATSKVTNTLK